MRKTADNFQFLDALAIKYGTDKASNHHNYTKVYADILSHRIDTVSGLLEIGVGGKNYRGVAGSSLEMWRDFFPNAQVVGIDIDPAAAGDYGQRIEVVVGDQTRRPVLDEALRRLPKADIIIDDGAHMNVLTIATFNYLFSKLEPGGIYVIEDTQCGAELRLGNYRTQMEKFFLSIISSIEFNGRIVTKRNMADFEKISKDYVMTELERWVESISIYRGMYVIYKRAS